MTWVRAQLGRHWRTLVGSLLFAAGVLIAVNAASRASQPGVESNELSVWMVVLSSVLNLGSVWLFSQNGRPDPTHAAASVRRLVELASRTQRLSVLADEMQSASEVEMREEVVRMSGQLNYLAKDVFGAVEDWTSFNGAAEGKVADLDAQAADAAQKAAAAAQKAADAADKAEDADQEAAQTSRDEIATPTGREAG